MSVDGCWQEQEQVQAPGPAWFQVQDSLELEQEPHKLEQQLEHYRLEQEEVEHCRLEQEQVEHCKLEQEQVELHMQELEQEPHMRTAECCRQVQVQEVS